MGDKESYCFSLTKFVYNIPRSWKELQKEKDFADVTLACEDKHILAHKIVLSFSSPVLRDILKQNYNQNPLVYISGVKFKCLENLINFMYQGEVTIASEDLANFLDVAEDLRVRGLYEVNVESFDQKEDLPVTVQQNIIDLHPKVKSPFSDFENENIGDNNFQASEATENNERKYDIQKLVPVTLCDICNKEYTHLKKHKASVHEGKRIRYLCDKCDASYSQPGDLKIHVASAHKGVRYPCDECDSAPFMQAIGLRRHKAANHRGIRYQCNKCDYKATQKRNLIPHVKRFHPV